ncbi:MAG: hypothetical protein GTN64_05510 [Candidatus Latescibacteria bacterium]|nr:hypothetical protein [Candidatus Latescibacterota bacterium]NIO78067.1 hypothetical protein [Candidatus Latescibacterota bacterium]
MKDVERNAADIKRLEDQMSSVQLDIAAIKANTEEIKRHQKARAALQQQTAAAETRGRWQVVASIATGFLGLLTAVAVALLK